KYDSVVKVLHLNVDWAIGLEFNSNRNNCWWAAVVQEVKKSFSNHKVASSIPCRSVLEQGTEPLIAPDVQCAISVNVKCVYIVSRFVSHCKSLWIKVSAK